MSNWVDGNFRYTRQHIDHILDRYAQYANPWGGSYEGRIATLYPAVVVPHAAMQNNDSKSGTGRNNLGARTVRQRHIEPDWRLEPLREKCDIDMAVDSLGKTPWQAILLGEVPHLKGFPKITVLQRVLLGPFVGIADMELEAGHWVNDVYHARAEVYGRLLWFLNGRKW